MTLNEYNKAIENLRLIEPKDIPGGEVMRWWREQKKQLQKQLSEEDLKIVQDRQKKWQDKVQSSFD